MSILSELIQITEEKKEKEPEKKVEAYGVKGMNSTPWRKTFKNRAALDKWVEQNDGDVEVHGTREVDESVEIDDESIQIDEKVFDNERYDWYVWVDNKPSKSFDRRGGSTQLARGDQFGLRAATSKPGTWRMIVKHRGPSIIFSIEARDAQALIDKAVKIRKS